MEKSFLHFKATNPDWQPDPASSVFLYRLKDQLSDSMHSGGDVARGFGLQDAKLKEKSRSYDRAYARSSHLLRGKLAGVGGVDEEAEDEERDDEDQEEEGEMESWNQKVDRHDEGEEGDETFLRDVGMVGLLQQVLHQ